MLTKKIQVECMTMIWTKNHEKNISRDLKRYYSTIIFQNESKFSTFGKYINKSDRMSKPTLQFSSPLSSVHL